MSHHYPKMEFSRVKGLSLLASCALAVLRDWPTDLTTPFQQRIGVKGPDAISIGWNTYKQPSQPCVQYGTSDKYLDMQQCSNDSVTYPPSRTHANTVILSGLEPATTYYYKIESTNSTIEHFFSPRHQGDRSPFAVNVFSDLGVHDVDRYTTNVSMGKRDTIPHIEPALEQTTIGQLASTIDDYELVVHPGGLAYADDWILEPLNTLLHTNASFGEVFEDLANHSVAFQAIIENFYDQLAPIAARKPYMVGPGSHDARCVEERHIGELFCPLGHSNFTDFMTRFGPMMPTAFTSKSGDSLSFSKANRARMLARPPLWYSFEYGMVHFVMIDTETDFESAPDQLGGFAGLDSGPFGSQNQQLEFLEADLSSVDRSVTPWVVVSGHRPWYTTLASGDGPCLPCQAAFEPLLYRYGVDLAIFGHVHNSQRFDPVFNGTADPKGLDDSKAPMYIVAGAAGSIEGLDHLVHRPASTAWAYDEDFNYAQIRFLDEKKMSVSFYRSTNGNCWIIRCCTSRTRIGLWINRSQLLYPDPILPPLMVINNS
ncbi:Metallo-dependent phosphatase-like protein [Apiospora arundinis]